MRETHAVKKMSQAFYPTNDGHIGNPKKLSMPQLLEIIERQEKLMKKKAFLKTLADKGEKIGQHLQVLREELERRKQESSRNNIESSSNSQQRLNDRLPMRGKNNFNDHDQSALSRKHTGIEQNQGVEGESVTDKSVGTSSLEESLEADFEKMNMGDKTVEREQFTRTKHQYEIAEERAERNSKEMKFYQRLNRNLNIANVEELPSELRHNDTDTGQRGKSERKTTQVEESAAVPPRYRYEEVKVIPLDESLKLQTSQKQKQEELQAQMAAEKLAERLNLKLETYNPEGVDMSYRNRKTADGYMDSDDDEAEEAENVAGMADILESDTED